MSEQSQRFLQRALLLNARFCGGADEVARLAGVSRRTVYYFFARGRGRPATVRAIAGAMNLGEPELRALVNGGGNV